VSMNYIEMSSICNRCQEEHAEPCEDIYRSMNCALNETFLNNAVQYDIGEHIMRTGRSVSMDSRTWTPIGEVADAEFDGDVSAAIEALCREALKARGHDL